jgi:hypothetical protein
MMVYSVVLFVHVVSALVLAAALRLEALTLIHLRKATSPIEARFVMDLAPGFSVVAMGSLLLLLLSGGYMAAQASVWSLAWPKVAVAALLLIGPFGAVSGRKMGAIRRLVASGASADSDLMPKLQDPFLKFSIIMRVALVLGVVWLTTAKPGMAESLEGVGVFAVVGAFSALLFSRRGGISPVVNASSRN